MSWLELTLMLVAGIAIGICYFGGLWWTVNRLENADNPLALYLASFVLRMAVFVACMWLVLQVGTLHLLTVVAGFLIARFFLVYNSTRPKPFQFKAKASR